MSQNSKCEEAKQGKGREGDEGWLRKELEECREQLKKLKSELLRKEYKHDTEMVCEYTYVYRFIIQIDTTFRMQSIFKISSLYQGRFQPLNILLHYMYVVCVL